MCRSLNIITHTPVIHFDILNFKNEEILFYSVGPVSRYIAGRGFAPTSSTR